MADLQRNYTIPLRIEFLKAPKYKRAAKAVRAVKAFLIKHMKAKDVKIHKELHEAIFKNGRKNPPGKVKVTAVRTDDVVRVNLEGLEIEAPKKKETKEEKKEAPKEELTKSEEQKKKEEAAKQEILHTK